MIADPLDSTTPTGTTNHRGTCNVTVNVRIARNRHRIPLPFFTQSILPFFTQSILPFFTQSILPTQTDLPPPHLVRHGRRKLAIRLHRRLTPLQRRLQQPNRRTPLPNNHRQRQHRLHPKTQKVDPTDIAPKRIRVNPLNPLSIQHAILRRRQRHIRRNRPLQLDNRTDRRLARREHRHPVILQRRRHLVPVVVVVVLVQFSVLALLYHALALLYHTSSVRLFSIYHVGGWTIARAFPIIRLARDGSKYLDRQSPTPLSGLRRENGRSRSIRTDERRKRTRQARHVSRRILREDFPPMGVYLSINLSGATSVS